MSICCVNPNSVIAVNNGPVRPDCSSGERRFASMLRAIEETRAVALFMRNVETDGMAALRKYFAGEILWDSGGDLSEALFAKCYGCCLAEGWRYAESVVPVARRIAPWMPVIVDSVDVHFLREEAAVRLGLMSADAVAARKLRELAVYEKADAVIAVTDQDKAALVSSGITKPIHIIPNIVASRPRPRIERKREILFVGAFGHPPNVDGILWFARECWPFILERAPDARLTLVGDNPPDEVMALKRVPDIDVTGFVPDVGPYLDRAAVSIAPLRYGGGMKGKVCEALAAGLPLVTTTPGAQGLALRDRVGARVQDAPGGFAEAVVWALEHPEAAEAMGAEGRRIIEAACSIEAVSGEVRNVFGQYSQSPKESERMEWLRQARVFKRYRYVKRLAIAAGARSIKSRIRKWSGGAVQERGAL